MRIEKRFLAFGHDLDTDITPLAAGLGFSINWDSDFIGKQALLSHKERGIENELVTIVLDDTNAVPLGNEPVYYNGEIIGKTTSAAFGYRIGKPVAIAQLNMQQPIDKLSVEIDIARSLFSGTTFTQPAFDPEGHRMR